MRGKTLWVLTAVVVAVGAFIFLFERHQPTTDELAERAEKILPDLEPDDVTEIEISGGADSVRLVRLGEAWRLAEPLEFPADTSRVNTLLTTLEGLSAERRLEVAEVAPADYGLEAPSFTVVLRSGDDRVTTLAVGDETPLGNNRALRVDGADEIAIVSAWFVSDLDRAVDDWRSRDVVEVFADQTASFELLRGGDRIQAVRVDDRWQLLDPLEDLADRDHVRNVISDLNTLRIEEFLDGEVDLAELGLDAPEAEVTVVRSDGGEPARLAFGATRTVDGATQVACRRGDGEYFWVNNVAATRLTKAPVLWRSPKVWPFDTWEVDRLAVTAADASAEVTRTDMGWMFSDDESADYTAVQERLSSLSSLEATGYDLVAPITPELGRVILGFDPVGDDDENEPERTVELVFHAPLADGGDAMVTVSERATVMSVDRAQVDEILADPDALGPAPEPEVEMPGVGRGDG